MSVDDSHIVPEGSLLVKGLVGTVLRIVVDEGKDLLLRKHGFTPCF